MVLILLAGLWALAFGSIRITEQLRLKGQPARLYGASLLAMAFLGLPVLNLALSPVIPRVLIENDAVRILMNFAISIGVIIGLTLPFKKYVTDERPTGRSEGTLGLG